MYFNINVLHKNLDISFMYIDYCHDCIEISIIISFIMIYD